MSGSAPSNTTLCGVKPASKLPKKLFAGNGLFFLVPMALSAGAGKSVQARQQAIPLYLALAFRARHAFRKPLALPQPVIPTYRRRRAAPMKGRYCHAQGPGRTDRRSEAGGSSAVQGNRGQSWQGGIS